MLKTEFIEERKEGETLSLVFSSNDKTLKQKINKLSKKNRAYKFIITCLLIWNIVSSVWNVAAGLIAINNSKYPQDVVSSEATVEDNVPVINEDLSSFTLVPLKEIPKN